MRIKFSSGMWIGFVIGTLLLAAGVVISPLTIVGTIRTIPESSAGTLLMGAVLFKIGLVFLGLTTLLFSRFFPRQANGERVTTFPAPNGRLTFLILLALLLIALALRLYSLDSGLWHDEILAYVLYAKLPFGEILTTYDSENQHVLYSLLAHAMLSLFGDSGWALRLPAVGFGVASIGALYLLGRKVSTSKEALLAVALLTFSYHHIWFSQNARGYTALLFFTLVTSWLLLRALDEARPELWLWFALATALGVYAHLTMLFVTMGHFAVYLTALWSRHRRDWPHRWAGLLWGFGLAGLLTFQLYALVIPQILSGLNETSEVAEWKQPLWTILELAKGLELSFAGGLIAFAALILAGAGLLSFVRTSPRLVLMSVVPPVVGAAVVIGAGHHLWPRFFFFAFGFAALVAMRGALVVGDWIAGLIFRPNKLTMHAGVTLGVVLVLVSAKSLPYVYMPKQDFAGALAFIEANQQPGDAVVTVGLATFTFKNLYKLNWEEVKTVADLEAVRAHAKRTWLIYTLAPEAEAAYPNVMASVRRDFEVAKEFYGSVGDGDIFVCVAGAPIAMSVTGLRQSVPTGRLNDPFDTP